MQAATMTCEVYTSGNTTTNDTHSLQTPLRSLLQYTRCGVTVISDSVSTSCHGGLCRNFVESVLIRLSSFAMTCSKLTRSWTLIRFLHDCEPDSAILLA